MNRETEIDKRHHDGEHCPQYFFFAFIAGVHAVKVGLIPRTSMVTTRWAEEAKLSVRPVELVVLNSFFIFISFRAARAMPIL